jgi:hypothetical protein
MNSLFEIKLLNIHWLNNEKEVQLADLCAHGNVYVKINNEILSDIDTNVWTISVTGLYLLRTLTQNYTPSIWSNYLLPCCGHFFIKENEEPVIILGCDIGIDWTIIHEKDNKIKHISQEGSIAIIDKNSYREMILEFTDKIENFYKRSIKRNIFDDNYQKEGYEAFWAEWYKLKNNVS